MSIQATFWNGEPCEARMVTVTVGKAPRSTWWCAPFEGQSRQAVEVTYHDQKFYLDNEDGSGWVKVTKGRGSPAYYHASLPVERVVEPRPWPSPHKISLNGCAKPTPIRSSAPLAVASSEKPPTPSPASPPITRHCGRRTRNL